VQRDRSMPNLDTNTVLPAKNINNKYVARYMYSQIDLCGDTESDHSAYSSRSNYSSQKNLMQFASNMAKKQ